MSVALTTLAREMLYFECLFKYHAVCSHTTRCLLKCHAADGALHGFKFHESRAVEITRLYVCEPMNISWCRVITIDDDQMMMIK